MVVIRLARHGSKKKPFYHVVATDSRNARDGRYIEKLGFYNPIAGVFQERSRLDMARVDYWLGVGAKPSAQVAKLIKDTRKTGEKAAA
ncbi:MAG: 30S ribosomal protein S16 [marine bacterium B5-7]|nr:MAG: 30S ribosomal protein S16 [marine bacterium B5-7]